MANNEDKGNEESKWKDAIVHDLAKHMQSAGYSVTGKLFPYLISFLIALIGIIYGYLVSSDAMQRAAIQANDDRQTAFEAKVDEEHKVFSQAVTDMANNVYQLCAVVPSARCKNPGNNPVTP
jgi:glutamine cyclotransferase